MKIINLEQGSSLWSAWRFTKLGASDSAAILGKSNFATAYEVWCEKMGYTPSFTGNAATDAGKNAEDKARAEYEMLHGDFEEFKPICIEHSEYGFISASLDGYSENLKRFVEIKYPSQKSHDLALSGQVPEHYWIQMQHQYLVCDEADNADYWSYREGAGAKVSVEKDEKFINEILLPALISFNDLINSKTPPPLTDKDAKWDDSPLVLSMFEELFTLGKEKQKALGAKIIDLVGHKKVRSRLGLVTTVEKKNSKSYLLIRKADQ